MWGMNRFDRPSWSTGLFVALACVVAGMAGYMVFRETRRVAKSSETKTPDGAVAEKGDNFV
jgi:NO-binding membrane sensor protein with MHYT domain